VISIPALTRSLHGDRVAFDEHGDLLEMDIPDGFGPATLVVSEVTDALKSVDDTGLVSRSVDRGAMWVVDAIVVSRIVLTSLEPDELTIEGLLEAVRRAGFDWQISPTSAL
jgi:hypothetical protein